MTQLRVFTAGLVVLGLAVPLNSIEVANSSPGAGSNSVSSSAAAALAAPSGMLVRLPNGKTRFTIQLSKELAGKTVLIKHSQKNSVGTRISRQRSERVGESGLVRFVSKRNIKPNSSLTISDGIKVLFSGKVRSLTLSGIPNSGNAASPPPSGGGGGGGGFGPTPPPGPEQVGFSPKNLVSAVRIGSSVHVVWNQLESSASEPRLFTTSNNFYGRESLGEEYVVTLENSQGVSIGECRTPAISFTSHNCEIEIPLDQTNLVGLEIDVAIVDGLETLESLEDSPAQVILESANDNPSDKVLDVDLDGGGVDPQCDMDYGFDSGQVSPDGINFAFRSGSEFLVDGDENCKEDVFTMNLVSGEISLISTSSAGSQGNENVSQGTPTWSPDGRWLSFSSPATNLTPGVTDGIRHLYIKNIETGELILVDTSLEGDTGNGETCGSDGYWSPDSTRVAFDSASSNLVTGDTNASCDVFVKNLLSGEIERVSLDAAGGQIMDPSYIQNSVSYTNRNFWSEGGDYVRFLTPAGLLDSDSDNDYDWYGKSLSDGSLTLNPEGFISDAGGPRPWSSFDPSGSLLAYVGDALKLYVEESGVPRLIAENVHPNDVSWTPDGSRIVIAMPSGIGVFFP